MCDSELQNSRGNESRSLWKFWVFSLHEINSASCAYYTSLWPIWIVFFVYFICFGISSLHLFINTWSEVVRLNVQCHQIKRPALLTSLQVLNHDQVLIGSQGKLRVPLHINDTSLHQRVLHHLLLDSLLSLSLFSITKQLVVHLSDFPCFLMLFLHPLISHLSGLSFLISQTIGFVHQILVQLHVSKSVVDLMSVEGSWLIHASGTLHSPIDDTLFLLFSHESMLTGQCWVETIVATLSHQLLIIDSFWEV